MFNLAAQKIYRKYHSFKVGTQDSVSEVLLLNNSWKCVSAEHYESQFQPLTFVYNISSPHHFIL